MITMKFSFNKVDLLYEYFYFLERYGVSINLLALARSSSAGRKNNYVSTY